jgi:methylated-DNA-[protein]-cysteine S-methyltransferase
MNGAEVFETAWGWVVLGWRNGRLFRLRLPAGEEVALEEAGRLGVPVQRGVGSDLARSLVWYFEGRRVDLTALLEYPPATALRRRIWDLTMAVRYGTVTTYGELARRAGRPKAARSVGSAMAVNALPLVVPCHRVAAASGKLGGYSAPGGVDLKRRLLELEGVHPDR